MWDLGIKLRIQVVGFRQVLYLASSSLPFLFSFNFFREGLTMWSTLALNSLSSSLSLQSAKIIGVCYYTQLEFDFQQSRSPGELW